MPTKIFAWDPAEALDTPEMQAEYLSLVFADGDPAEVARALGIVARARGMTAVAVGENDNLELSTMLGVLRALGMKVTITPL